MTNCPSCKAALKPDDKECPACGLIFAKWEALQAARAAGPAVSLSAEAAPAKKGGTTGWAVLAALAIAGAVWALRGSDERKITAAFGEFREALRSEDPSKLSDLVAAEYRDELLADDARMKIALVNAMIPAKTEVAEVTVEGDAAVVRATGVTEGSPVTGTTRFVKEGGRWKVSKMDWNVTLSVGGAAAGDGPLGGVPELDPSFPSEVWAEFEEVARLPGNPRGLAFARGGFLIGNREKPWGFMRAGPRGDRVRKTEVFDHTGQNPAGFDAVTWNGTEYVSLTGPGVYVPTGRPLFNAHDAETLRPVRHAGAPPHLGGVAWDGAGYWAATRQNTEDSGEGAFLYRLDAGFNVLQQAASPAKGCQGLAWIAGHLWLADVFSGRIFVVDVGGGEPRTVRTYHTGLSYLSGLAFDGTDLHVVEYGEKKLWRLKREQLGFAGGPSSTAAVAPPAPTAATPAPAPADLSRLSPYERSFLEEHGAKSDRELLDMLRTESAPKTEYILRLLVRKGAREPAASVLNERLRDKTEGRSPPSWLKGHLEQLGVSLSYDWHKRRESAPPAADELELLEWEIELRGDSLYSSGRIFIGRDVVEGYARPSQSGLSVPTFARYRLTVKGGTLPAPVELTFDADRRAGEQAWNGVLLASGLGPGRYDVSPYLHAQTVPSGGTPLSINRNYGDLTVEKR
jgi:hypothetical protein